MLLLALLLSCPHRALTHACTCMHTRTRKHTHRACTHLGRSAGSCSLGAGLAHPQGVSQARLALAAAQPRQPPPLSWSAWAWGGPAVARSWGSPRRCQRNRPASAAACHPRHQAGPFWQQGCQGRCAGRWPAPPLPLLHPGLQPPLRAAEGLPQTLWPRHQGTHLSRRLQRRRRQQLKTRAEPARRRGRAQRQHWAVPPAGGLK